eukprot:9023827-Alexandrium_andersonii.AAC.1
MVATSHAIYITPALRTGARSHAIYTMPTCHSAQLLRLPAHGKRPPEGEGAVRPRPETLRGGAWAS